MAADLIPVGFTDRPAVLPLAHGGFRTVTLLGRVDETNFQIAAGGTDDLRAPHTHSAARRREFLAGRALLRLAVAELTGTPAEKVQIGARDDKRPFCSSAREVGVSISHSAGRIAVTAAHGCEVGIDIQIPVPVSARLLHRYDVAGSEPTTWAASWPRRDGRSPVVPVAGLGGGNEETRAAKLYYEFADAWTVREACAKSLGLRVRADLWRIRVPPGAQQGNWGGTHWYRMPPFQGCPVALALRPGPERRTTLAAEQRPHPSGPRPGTRSPAPKNRQSINQSHVRTTRCPPPLQPVTPSPPDLPGQRRHSTC